MSVILISHNLEHVMKVADRAVVLRQGKYVGEETPDAEHHERLVGDDRGQRGEDGLGRRGPGSDAIAGASAGDEDAAAEEDGDEPRARFLAALLGAVALLLAACGGQLAPDTSKGLRIGFVPKSLNQEYWVNTRHGAEAGGRAAHAKVVTLAAQSDTHIAEQIDLVENLLAQKVDALVIAPNDSDLLQAGLEKAAKRIPVVLFDSPIPGWKPQTAYVGTANKQGGVEMGEVSCGASFRTGRSRSSAASPARRSTPTASTG